MERTLTLDDLREFEQYPGLAVDRKAHFSRFANKTIVHRDYHRNYTLMTYYTAVFHIRIYRLDMGSGHTHR